MMTIACSSDVLAWSNGGYTDDPSNPDYGTHDWIAEHALDWLPEEEKRYIVGNLATYLYGTELPDNGIAPDGIGDTTKHHIYYWSNGSLQDDASAVRASEEYDNTLSFLKLGDLASASKTAGIMSHYVVDVAVFGHVMGAGTDWAAEEHHSDYETYVNERTSSYDAEFNIYLSFDGGLDLISAYDAARELAYDTTFDADGDLTCVWMDQNYNWSDPVFKNRCGESLNLAVNYLTGVLHTLYLEAASVHNIDTRLDYSTIQAAISAAETLEGHTILVDAGTYYENVIVNKSVSLVGESEETTIIDGSSAGNVMEVTVDIVIIMNLTIRNSGVGWPNSGILLDHAKNCNVSGNKLTNNNNGIRLCDSSNNTIFRNNMTDNNVGIAVWDFSRYNIISRNYVANNSPGIWLYESSDNSLYGNEIADNNYGIRECSCAINNKIYHNNFMTNADQVYSWNSSNVWGDGYPSGGNYWKNYIGVDLYSGPHQDEPGSDGIGDTPHIDKDVRDGYPLMGPINFYAAGTWNETAYYVDTVSNCTVSDFHFSEVDKLASFNVTGPDDSLGFCRVTLPNIIVQNLWKGNYYVMVDGEPPLTIKNWTDSTYTYVYFTCIDSEHKVVIVPEFLPWTSLPLLIVFTVVIAIYRRRSFCCS
jgi:parallel beta-helix repeat protein